MNTSEYRQQIDQIDEKIIDLFSQRMEIAEKIGEYKKQHNLPVLDSVREHEKLVQVIERSPNQLKSYSPLLYSTIMELSRSYQGRVMGSNSELTEKINNAIDGTPKLFPEYASVACQGIEGANSQFACDRLFKNANTLYFSSFNAVFSAIESGICRYGVLPVENSSAGSVNAIYDLMMNHKFSIVRSVRVKIDHNLLAKSGTKMSDIREIYSHEQAISQCSEFLEGLSGVKVIPCENTAVAAKMVADSDRKDVAALASRPCISYYNLECLEDAVQNTDSNYTRFICISKDLEIYPGADKTSIMLTLPHEQGSLYRVMARFNALGINLNKLESRPLPGREFEFMFYFDLDAPVYSPAFIQLMAELPDICDSFTYLGSYSEII